MTGETRHRRRPAGPEDVDRRAEAGGDAAAFFGSADRDAGWAALMARAQDGDAAAYLQLLQEITPHVRALAARWHGDGHEAEEAVQDIVLTLHSIRRTYDPAHSFAAWLAGIAAGRARRASPRHGRPRVRDLPIATEHRVLPATE